MKFLILGVSGMAGHIIAKYLQESGHQVVGYSRRTVPGIDCIQGDARDLLKLEQIISKGDFDTVVNAIGVLNQFAETDKENAAFVNAYLPHYLAKVTENKATRVIHMSTDCVFSGKTGPYKESAFPDGESFYDRSKALGELQDGKNLTLRNSIVGPDINANGIGLLNWFMKQNGTINGYTTAMWTGLTTLELAKVIEYAALNKASGLVNMVNDHNISKYELLRLFNHYLRHDAVDIQPSEAVCLDKTLVRTNWDMNYTIPSYETMVKEMASWVRAHASLYPHYFLTDR